MEKSADAFRTISEVADDLSLPQHVLRFWETRFPQIRPLKRAGGRRYYRPADVVLLRSIRQLLYDDGYTIKGVQRLLKEQGARGLGGGPRQAEPAYGEGSDATDLDDELLDEDAVVEPSLVDGRSPAADPMASGSARDVVEDALATMEECRRILDAVLRPR